MSAKEFACRNFLCCCHYTLTKDQVKGIFCLLGERKDFPSFMRRFPPSDCEQNVKWISWRVLYKVTDLLKRHSLPAGCCNSGPYWEDA